jgi:hypothetical protein
LHPRVEIAIYSETSKDKAAAVPESKTANRFDSTLRLATAALYLCSLPMDFLNGHGKGFLAEADHFQGYEVLLLIPLHYAIPLLSDGSWLAAIFIGCIGLSNFAVGIGPFIDWHRMPRGVAIAAGTATLVSAGTFTFWTIQLGLLPGYITWMTGTACGVTWMIRGHSRK